MANCKICGRPVLAGNAFHSSCWEAKAKEMAQRTSRLVTGEIRETVPKYHAVSGVVKSSAPTVREVLAARARQNLRQSLRGVLPPLPRERVIARYNGPETQWIPATAVNDSCRETLWME